MEFTKKDSGKLVRVGMSWRKPRGRKNKTKVGKKGHKPMPSKGFMSSVKTRGKIANKIPLIVYTPSDLGKINENNIVIIASAVGSMKRAKILEECKSKNIQVVNHERNVKNTETTSK